MRSYTSPAKVSNRELSNGVDRLVKVVRDSESQIAAALPGHLDPKRMIRIIVTEIRKNPLLAECDQPSFLASILQCAQIGLEPGALLGQAYLIPTKNRKNEYEVELRLGYQGMVELAERSGNLTIDAFVVYEKDEFNFTFGLSPTCYHKPYWGIQDRGDVIGAYAVARYKDGRVKFRVLSRRDIESARLASPSSNSKYSPWSTHYDEMARKTAVRRLWKMIPKSPEMAMAGEIEETADLGIQNDRPQISIDEMQAGEVKIENSDAGEKNKEDEDVAKD